MAVSWVRSRPGPRGRDVLVLRVGPEVRVHDVQVDLHPGRVHLPGQREVAGQVAVAGRRVDPEPDPDVVRARVAGDRHRGAGPAVVAEPGAHGEFLRGEGQVGAEGQAGRGGVGPVRPELAYAHVGVARCRCRRSPRRTCPGCRTAAGSTAGGPGRARRRAARAPAARPRRAGQLDRGRSRRAGRVQREAEIGQRPDLAEVHGQRPGIARGAPVGARVTVDRVRRGLSRLRRGRAGRAGQRPVHGGRRARAAVGPLGAAVRVSRVRLPSGRAWAVVAATATTASGTATRAAQAAATSRGRRPGAGAAARPVRII